MTHFTAFAAITACRAAVPRQDDSGGTLQLPVVPESAIHCVMSTKPSALPPNLPGDLEAALALLATVQAECDRLAATNTRLETTNTQLQSANTHLQSANARLEQILAEIRRAHFGRKSERISDDQLALALEELETAAARIEAEVAKAKPKTERTRRPRQTSGDSLDHLPHEEIVIEPAGGTTCPCCRGALHRIGEDTAKRLDKVPAKVRVIVEIRPKYACRTCEKTGAPEACDRDVAGIVQAPAPAHLIEGGLPTEALVADIVVSKHADHLPLYRQSQILARHGVKIERSTLAHWVGAAAAELQPLHDHLLKSLKASPKLFCDETRCPVLDPGRGKTKTGFLWALARDDRPWAGSDPPAVVYAYAPGRGAEHAVKLLDGFGGILQVDGYAAYNPLTAPSRPGGPVTLAFCWAHVRRKFYELHVGGHQPIATEALARLKKLYDIEADVRGRPAELRQSLRQKHAKPVIEALKPWLEARLAEVSKGGKLGTAIRYALNRWDGLVRYLDDGRIEIDSNTVERSIRGVCLTRKNALFAGHDAGGTNWAMIATLLETCKLNAVDPLAWLADVLGKLVNLWPASRIGELMPWAWVAAKRA
jgi:transposase